MTKIKNKKFLKEAKNNWIYYNLKSIEEKAVILGIMPSDFVKEIENYINFLKKNLKPDNVFNMEIENENEN